MRWPKASFAHVVRIAATLLVLALSVPSRSGAAGQVVHVASRGVSFTLPVDYSASPELAGDGSSIPGAYLVRPTRPSLPPIIFRVRVIGPVAGLSRLPYRSVDASIASDSLLSYVRAWAMAQCGGVGPRTFAVSDSVNVLSDSGAAAKHRVLEMEVREVDLANKTADGKPSLYGYHHFIAGAVARHGAIAIVLVGGSCGPGGAAGPEEGFDAVARLICSSLRMP